MFRISIIALLSCTTLNPTRPVFTQISGESYTMVNSPLTSIGSPFVAWSGVGIQDFASDSCVRRTTQRPRNGVVEGEGMFWAYGRQTGERRDKPACCRG